MIYGSICSGIESASIAWEPLGMRPAWFAEIEPFPSAVLAHHWPNVGNLGDMMVLSEFIASGLIEAPDILVGGTPCQAFSVAGKRKGLDDERGLLTLKFVEIANEIDKKRPGRECITVWENVPGVLSDKQNAFGWFLGLLAGEDCELKPAGKKWTYAGVVYGPKRTIAWRILDAQYFGVAQRRRRVFVIASARKGFDPTKVLFESEGLRRDSPPSRKTQTPVAALTACGVGTCGADDNQAQAGHLITCFDSRQDPNVYGDLAGPCSASIPPNAILTIPIHATSGTGSCNGLGVGNPEDPVNTLTARDNHAVFYNTVVRRLTPVECERLQGFPDNHVRIPWKNKSVEDCPDGPRYKAIGNSKAVPVIKWIGERIKRALHES